MDQQKYLRRINYNAGTQPSMELLTALQKNHLLNIPFENLDIHYGKTIELNIEKIFEKIGSKKRGGFCYELNGLFFELLKSMGFNVKMISARVFDKTQQEFTPEFDHMALIVKINSSDYLVDVGFGEFAFQPLKLELSKIQADDRGIFRIEKYDDEYLSVNKQASEHWIPEYIFTLKERRLEEFEDMCQYNQISPLSHFTQKRICSIPTKNGRISLTDDKVKITIGDTSTEHKITTEEEFIENLEKYFDIKLNFEPNVFRVIQ